MKYKVRPQTQLPDASSAQEEPTPALSDISVQRLIDDGLTALYREMRNLLIRSSKGKLEASDSRDLRDTLKLLFELKDREADSLRRLSDEDLKAAIKNGIMTDDK